MANVIYEVRFTLGEGLENANPSEAPKFKDDEKAMTDGSKPRDTNDIISDKDAKKRKAKIVAKASLAISTTMLATNMFFNYQNTNYQISGDYIGAQRMQNTQQQVNELVGYASTIGMGFALGGPVGGVAAIAYSGFQLALKAINHSMETRKYFAEMQANIKESSYQRERLVTNIVDIR